MPQKGRSNEEIVHALVKVESGEKVTEVCRQLTALNPPEPLAYLTVLPLFVIDFGGRQAAGRMVSSVRSHSTSQFQLAKVRCSNTSPVAQAPGVDGSCS
jgi:hypothetical protein